MTIVSAAASGSTVLCVYPIQQHTAAVAQEEGMEWGGCHRVEVQDKGVRVNSSSRQGEGVEWGMMMMAWVNEQREEGVRERNKQH